MPGLPPFLRKRMPASMKRRLGAIVTSWPVGQIIRIGAGKTINHRGARLVIDHPRVTNTMVALLFLGLYEREEADFITHHLPSDHDVVELGASSGAITMLIAGRLEKGRRVVSLEADPQLHELASKNVALNGATERVTLLNRALHYDAAEVGFRRGASSLGGSVADGAGDFTVPAETLSNLAAAHKLQDYTLVMDIEGAEYGIISRPEELDGCGMIIAELHETSGQGATVTVNEMIARLENLGFGIVERYGVCVVMKRPMPVDAPADSDRSR